jgi:hypothetical protein
MKHTGHIGLIVWQLRIAYKDNEGNDPLRGIMRTFLRLQILFGIHDCAS